jgi:protease-4
VSEGRKLDPRETYEVAQGRAWLGDDARERKLVDGIGGLESAIAEARRLGHVPEGERIAPREYRRPRGAFIERLLGSWLREQLGSALRLSDQTGAQARAEDWVEDLD